MKTTPGILAPALLLTAILSGCSGGAAPEPTPTEPARASVPWEDYSPEVKTRIDDMTAAKDCTGLGEEFDTAEQMSGPTENRTGHGNDDLLAYIYEGAQLAGCVEE